MSVHISVIWIVPSIFLTCLSFLMERAAKTEGFQGLVRRLLLQVNYNPPTQIFAKTVPICEKTVLM